jgi:hypothetical protein
MTFDIRLSHGLIPALPNLIKTRERHQQPLSLFCHPPKPPAPSRSEFENRPEILTLGDPRKPEELHRLHYTAEVD